MTARTCSDCPSTLGRKNRSGRCRGCVARNLNSSPEIHARRRAGIAAKFEDPAFRALHIERTRKMGASLSEEARARRSELSKLKVDHLRRAAQNMTAEQRAAAGRSRSETVLAWCPPEWRDRYRYLKSRGRSASEAKRMVLDLIAGRPLPQPYAQQRSKLNWCPESRKDEYRKLAKTLGAAEARRTIEADLTPFERQMAKVAAGAKLIEKPVFRQADPTMTLGGVATGLL